MMKRIIAIMLAALLILSCGVSFAANGTSNIYDGYTFDFFGNIKSTPAAFTLAQVIDADSLGAGRTFGTISDVCTSPDGRIFIVDSNPEKTFVYVLNADGSLATITNAAGAEVKNVNPINNLKVAHSNPDNAAKGRTENAYIDPQGNLVDKKAAGAVVAPALKGCEGVFYHAKQDELYLADTGNQRIVVLDGQTLLLKRLIGIPADMTGSTKFAPSKIAVDNADRIYRVMQSSQEGIVELNEDGSFSRYFGVNEPTVNLLDIFWRSLYTDKQKADAKKIYAPPFTNVALDGEGFIMAVTSESAASQSVFRLNFAGANVLREMGNTPVIGDLRVDKPSSFTDIAVKPYGVYAVLDKANGRVFLYNFDGELLTVFGSMGNIAGQFRLPTGIAWLGDKLVISDSGLKCAYIYEPTEFGTALLGACEDYYYGEWDDATAHFEEVLRLCANLETAYVGIGKNKLMQEDYEAAMRYFKLGNNHEFYSRAYKGYRSVVMKENFGVIAVIAVLAIGGVLYSEVAYHRKQRRANK